MEITSDDQLTEKSITLNNGFRVGFEPIFDNFRSHSHITELPGLLDIMAKYKTHIALFIFLYIAP